MNYTDKALSDVAERLDTYMNKSYIDSCSPPVSIHVSKDNFVEVAIRFTHCCEGQINGPAFDWVEDGIIRGTLGGPLAQCGQCGHLGAGWVYTGAQQWKPNEISARDFLEGLISSAKALCDEERLVLREDVLARLQRDLDDLVATFGELTEENADEWATGSGVYPGAYFDDGQVIVWDYDPLSDCGDTLEVTK